MIKLDYRFTCNSPLHTGSDIVAGTLRTLRRQKCVLATPVNYLSRLTREDRYKAITNVLLAVWYSLPWDTIKGARAKGIWDEFANKLRAAATRRTKQAFIEQLCRSWGIESLAALQGEALKSLEVLSDFELLHTVRNESIYLCLKLRAAIDEAKAGRTEAGVLAFDTSVKAKKERVIVKTDDEVPCISGNSFRGRMRRLAIYDFCARVGITRLKKRAYHILFSGGFLDQSSQYQDYEYIERLAFMCPMLELFGAAIGNTTIQGDLDVGWAYPLCAERGTGGQSYWEYLDVVFQTRRDTSKTEDQIKVEDGQGKDSAPEQMMYQYEVFAPGTPFEHCIACTTAKPLIVSAFWHMLSLFDQDRHIGGMLGVGSGEIVPDWSLEKGAGAAYLEFLQEHQ